MLSALDRLRLRGERLPQAAVQHGEDRALRMVMAQSIRNWKKGISMASAARDSANMACVLCSPTAMMMPYSGTATAAVSSRERRTTERFQRSSKRKARKTRLRMQQKLSFTDCHRLLRSSTNSGSTSTQLTQRNSRAAPAAR